MIICDGCRKELRASPHAETDIGVADIFGGQLWSFHLFTGSMGDRLNPAGADGHWCPDCWAWVGRPARPAE